MTVTRPNRLNRRGPVDPETNPMVISINHSEAPLLAAAPQRPGRGRFGRGAKAGAKAGAKTPAKGKAGAKDTAQTDAEPAAKPKAKAKAKAKAKTAAPKKRAAKKTSPPDAAAG